MSWVNTGHFVDRDGGLATRSIGSRAKGLSLAAGPPWALGCYEDVTMRSSRSSRVLTPQPRQSWDYTPACVTEFAAVRTLIDSGGSSIRLVLAQAGSFGVARAQARVW